MNNYLKILSFLFLFLFQISFQAAYGSSYPKSSFESPRSTMNYFLKTMKGHKLGDKNAINLAILSFNQKTFSKNTKLTSQLLAAKRLIQSFDKLEYIDVKSIPIKTDFPIWIYLKKEVKLDNKIHRVEISLAQEKDKKWRFTPQTLKSVKYLLESLKQKKEVKGVLSYQSPLKKFKSLLPLWTGETWLIIKNGQWLGLFLIIFLSLIVGRFISFYFKVLIHKFFNKNKLKLEESATIKFGRLLSYIVFFLLWSLFISLLELDDQVLSILSRVGKIGLTVASVFSVATLVDLICIYLEKISIESSNKFDDILVPLIRKTIKTFVYAFGLVFIGDSLTLDMKGIIAGLGIGGIAFALAAKDTVSNIFGSLTVLLDRPFNIGDWVLINGKIEGTIESVGLRSTKIRTFYDSLISLPNGQLTNVHIDNYGKRTFRRYTHQVGLEYSTPPEKLEAFCEGIKKIILDHQYTRKDYFHVYFNGFGDSSLNILVYVFWKVPDWSKELEEKHKFLMDILQLGQNLNVNFAFPTQTLHIEKDL